MYDYTKIIKEKQVEKLNLTNFYNNNKKNNNNNNKKKDLIIRFNSNYI